MRTDGNRELPVTGSQERVVKQRGRSPRARRVVPDNLAAEVERSWTRLDELRAQSAATPGQLDDLALQATEELATALEELRVTAEELRVQNAELAEALTELTRERQRYQDLF